MSETESNPQLERILAQTVFFAGENIPFGDLSAEQTRTRAAELRAAVGWGPTARVAPVAMAWVELARAMDQDSAAAVRELDRDLVIRLAPKLWIVPPGGGMTEGVAPE